MPRLNSNLLSEIVIRFIAFALNLTALIIIARSVGPGGVGQYALTLLSGLSIVIIAMFSYGKVTAAVNSESPGTNMKLLGNGLFFSVIWGMFVTFLLAWKAEQILAFALPRLPVPLWNLITVLVFPLTLFIFCERFLDGLKKNRGYNLYRAIVGILLVAGVILFHRWSILTVEAAVSMWVGAIIIAALIQLISAWYQVGLNIRVDLRLMMAVLWSGMKDHIANVSTILRYRSDIFIAAYLLPMEDVGRYALALVMIALLHIVPKALITTTVTDRSSSVAASARFGLFTSIGIGLIYPVIVWFVIKYAVGDRFTESFVPFMILLPGVIINGLGKVLEIYVNSDSPAYARSITNSFLLAVNIALNLLLIPKFGIVGAAVSDLITYFLTATVFLIMYLYQTGASLSELFRFNRNEYKSLLSGR